LEGIPPVALVGSVNNYLMITCFVRDMEKSSVISDVFVDYWYRLQKGDLFHYKAICKSYSPVNLVEQ
jgi:enamine deaminase RidA (YjgF/YER057c/UK114 family)